MSSDKDHDLSKTFRILIASDIHLGYCEKHHERGKDSFVAFEEVLRLARDEDVDFILLGGDLFHLNKPSFQTLQKTIELLREYCLGCRPIQFEIVSNQSDNFSHYSNFKYANYLDDNLNVSMPVFTIHGNHDDPTGTNHISVLDSLSSAGLINYFGKYTNFDEIILSPILLQKGETKIALFGLGSVNEERLFRIVTEGKLNYCMPETDEEEWFKIVVVHQNRIKHGTTKYLPEKFLSSLPNLVIWGHEHESRPEPDWNDSESFFVYQPGSTVATSLCEAEAAPKHCGILEIIFDDITRIPQFRLSNRRLKTVRPFIWETIDIPDLITKKLLSDENSIREFAQQKVDEMIQTAKREHSGDKRQPKLPLIRLRLEYSDSNQQFHSAQFGAQFNGRIANHSDIVSYVRRKENHIYDEENFDVNQLRGIIDQEVISEGVNITDIIDEYFHNIKDPKHKLGLLSEKALTAGVIELVQKQSNDAINDVFESQKSSIKQCLLELKDLEIDDNFKLKEQIREIKSNIFSDKSSENLKQILTESRNKSKIKSEILNQSFNDSDDNFETNNNNIESDDDKSSKRGKGRTRGRGRGQSTTVKRDSKSKPRSSTQTTLDFITEPSTSGRRSTRTPAKKPKNEEIIYEISESE